MKKQRERVLRNKIQKPQSRWLMTAGLVLVLAASLWIAFSNRPSQNGAARPISRLRTNDFHSLAFSPTDPETVFFGHHEGLLVSLNSGKDWQSTSLINADAMALGVPASSSQTMYVAGHNVFVKSSDGGKTWQSVPADLPGSDIHAFVVDPENADRVFAYIVSFGLFSSDDGGINWEFLSLTIPNSIMSLAVGKDNRTLYAATMGAGLWQSQDGGRTWTPVQNTPTKGTIAVNYARAKDRLYLTTMEPAAGLYYSDDGGQTWTSARLNETLLAVAISPIDPDHIIAVNDQGEIFASRDGGASWNGR